MEENTLLMSGARDQNGQTGWRSWQGYRDSNKHRLQPRPAECHLCTHNTTNIQPVCTHRLEPTGHFIGYSTSKVYLLQWPVSIYNSLNEIFLAFKVILNPAGPSAFSKLSTRFSIHFPSTRVNVCYRGKSQRPISTLQTRHKQVTLSFCKRACSYSQAALL